MRHGRATMPWGKWKGTRIRLLPDDYLSWLTTSIIMADPKWRWLKDSLIAELKFRGLRSDLAATQDPIILIEPLRIGPDDIPEDPIRQPRGAP